ncbi:ankyrin repeat domain-containing protein [Paludisphaera soli]|uniref:ankyrin repeat domain-containing protein n=1 Tax=Paludisphaera soli TaxID=2712865 RepID=UPI0013EB9B53|nr:ankyrin repeat domain-containing protein [Paludisphaera soli]
MTLERLVQLMIDGPGAEGLLAYLRSGGSVNAVDPRSGMPILHLACEHQNLEMARALIEAGADINLQDSFGQLPLHVAVDIDIDSVVQSGSGEDFPFATTRLLLDLGADPQARAGDGRTPRDWAAACGPEALKRFDLAVRQTRTGLP